MIRQRQAKISESKESINMQKIQKKEKTTFEMVKAKKGDAEVIPLKVKKKPIRTRKRLGSPADQKNLPTPVRKDYDKKQPIYDQVAVDQQAKLLSIQSGIENRLISVKINIYEMGKLLSDAKSILPHGAFQPWIEETFRNEMSYQMAANLKAIYEKFESNPRTVKLLPITFLMHMKQKSFPDEILQLVNENPAAAQQCDLVHMKKLHRELNQGEISVAEFNKMAKEQIDMGKAILEGESHVRHSLRAKRTTILGFTKTHRIIKKMREYSKTIRLYSPPADEDMFINDADNNEHNTMIELARQLLDGDLKKQARLCIKELEGFLKDLDNVDDSVLFKLRIYYDNGVLKNGFKVNLRSHN